MRKTEQRRQGHSIYTFEDAYFDGLVEHNGESNDWEDWLESSDINENTYDGFYELEMNDTYDDEIIKLKNRTNIYEKVEIK